MWGRYWIDPNTHNSGAQDTVDFFEDGVYWYLEDDEGILYFNETFSTWTYPNWNLSCRTNIFDGNYSSGCKRDIGTSATYRPEYNIPQGAIIESIVWQIDAHHSTSSNHYPTNFSIPPDCVDRTNELGKFLGSVRHTAGGAGEVFFFQCNNGTHWKDFESYYSDSSQETLFFEEAIYMYYSINYTGSEYSPHEIWNCSDLWESRLLNQSHHFKLMDDIDCSSFSFNTTPRLYNDFDGEFDGNQKFITGLHFNPSGSPTEVGFIGNAKDGARIKDVVFIDYQYNGDDGSITQQCGLIGNADNGATINISGVGFRESRTKCKVANSFFMGTRGSSQSVSISDSYVIDSVMNTIDTYNEMGVFVGFDNGGSSTYTLDKIISDVTHNYTGGRKSAIADKDEDITSTNTVWSNSSSLYAYHTGTQGNYEIDNSILTEPDNTAWENFSTDIWKFSEFSKPQFVWEHRPQNFTNIYTYDPAPECNENNYIDGGLAEWGHDTAKEIECMFSGSIDYFDNWNTSLKYEFCTNITSGELRSFNTIHTLPDYTPTTIFDKTMPYKYQWNNYKSYDFANATQKTISLISEKGWYYRYDINSTWNSTRGNYQWAALRIERCDGSMYEWSDPRCQENYSIYNSNSPIQNTCHLWFNEEVSMEDDRNFSGTYTWIFDNTTIDCGGNKIIMEDAYMGNEMENITHFTWKNCELENIGSGWTGIQTTYFNNYAPYDILIDNVKMNDPNNYQNFNFFGFENAYGNLTVQNSDSLGLLHDGNIQNFYFLNNTDTYGSFFELQLTGTDKGYALVEGNNFDNDNLKIYSEEGFDYADIIWNNAPNKILDVYNQGFLMIANMSYNNFQRDYAGFIVWEGFYDSYVGYNNFTSYNPNLRGDDDADPSVYNATNYNAYSGISFRYFNNTIFEYNNFHNVSGVVEIRYDSSYSTIRYNDFVEFGHLAVRQDSNHNVIHDNTLHCDNNTFGYGCYGIFLRDGSEYNTVYNNDITGHHMYGIYIRDSYNNYLSDNYVNLSFTQTEYDDMFDFHTGSIRGLTIRNSADSNTLFRNTIATSNPYQYNVLIDDNSESNNLTENDFYNNPVTNDVGLDNTFYCNTYNDGSLLIGSSDACYLNSPMVCNGIDNASVDVDDSYNWNVNCFDNDSISSFTINCSNFYYSTGVGNLSYLYQNSSIIESNITCSYYVCDDHSFSPECYEFSQSVVAITPSNQTVSGLSIGVCPTETTEVLILFGLIGIGLVLVAIGVFAPSALFGIFGCFVMIFSSFILSGCSQAIGYIFGALGVVGVLWFAFKET